MGSHKQYDLEVRTLEFARRVSALVERTPKTISNIEYCKQIVRSSGSTGANYIEANESFGKKDFLMRIKICKKEAKETRYWLQLMKLHDTDTEEQSILLQESGELMNIFGAILRNSR